MTRPHFAQCVGSNDGGFSSFSKLLLIRAIPDIHFGLETLSAFLAILPATFVAFVMMRTTEGITVMIAVAGIVREREENVIFLVIANPIVAAGRARQGFRGRSAQAAPKRRRVGLAGGSSGLGFLHIESFLSPFLRVRQGETTMSGLLLRFQVAQESMERL